MELQRQLKNKIQWPRWHFSRWHFFFLAGLLLPIAINLLVLHAFVEPLKKKVADLSLFVALAELKPRLEVLIAESNELMSQRIAKGLLANDAGMVLKEIREAAKIHKVEVNDLNILNEETTRGAVPNKILEAAGYKKVGLSLDIAGNYANIARWLASLDQKKEIRVDNFTLTPSGTGSCRLHVGLKILLRNS